MTKKKINKKKEDSVIIDFKLDRIELINKELNIPSDFNKNDLAGVKFRIKSDIDIVIERSIIIISIEYEFTKYDTHILKMVVENEYRFKDINLMVKNGEVQNGVLIDYLIGVSVAQSRGVQSFVIKDTLIDGLFIPSISPNQITANYIKK